MSVTDLDAHRHTRPGHPAMLAPFQATAKGLVVALGLHQSLDLPDCHVHVHSEGRCVTFDFTGTLHPARDVTSVCNRLGLIVEEFATTADGREGVELRGQDYSDGILRTVRAVIPTPGLFEVQP